MVIRKTLKRTMLRAFKRRSKASRLLRRIVSLSIAAAGPAGATPRPNLATGNSPPTPRQDRVAASSRYVGGETRRLPRWLLPLLWSVVAHGVLVILLHQVGVFQSESSRRVIMLRPQLDTPELEELAPLEAKIDPPMEAAETPLPFESESLQSVEIGEISDAITRDPVAQSRVEVQSPLSATGQLLQRSPGELLQSTGQKTMLSRTSFFGLQSQGRSVCFLVDSSRSMRGKFDLARDEVFRSVSALTPKQRFYVLLFDQNVERMRLGDLTPRQPVQATQQNKRLLLQWLAKTEMESSCNPEAALDAALGLDADVLFLLTDGELPATLLEMVRSRNRTSLDGVKRRKMAVNTIGLHSLRGRELLLRLAAENGGAYRFVPKLRK